jgi:ubiquinone/menaquinone biosynthesis C-methylase UbiE
MDKEYYKEYYNNERNHWWFKIREKIILDNITKHSSFKTPSILNIGAATGRSSEALQNIGSVTSLEYDADCCHFTKEKTGLDIIQGSILELPFHNNSFDIVCAFDVIEHVQDDQKAINEMKRVCKNEGIIVITVPAFMSLWSEHDDINHHYRRYKASQVKQLFSCTSNIVSESYFNTFLFIPIYLFRTISKIFKTNKTSEQKQDIKSDFNQLNNTLINSFFFYLFNIERHLLKTFRFPFGVSFMLTYINKPTANNSNCTDS